MGDQILFRFSFGFKLQGYLVSWGHSSSIVQLFLEKKNTNILTSLSGEFQKKLVQKLFCGTLLPSNQHEVTLIKGTGDEW